MGKKSDCIFSTALRLVCVCLFSFVSWHKRIYCGSIHSCMPQSKQFSLLMLSIGTTIMEKSVKSWRWICWTIRNTLNNMLRYPSLPGCNLEVDHANQRESTFCTRSLYWLLETHQDWHFGQTSSWFWYYHECALRRSCLQSRS